jgi:hypothetical protein
MKKAVTKPTEKKAQAEKCTIPISRRELLELHDIAAGLSLLQDITEKAPNMQFGQAEILIVKASRSAWYLVHDVLDSRWQERHPNVDLIDGH